jgi:hypothetical protein
LLGVAAALTAVVYVGIVLIDPFSTGRLTPIKRIDVATSDTVFGHAARVRDPRYDAAVIGNSHAILIDPARLSDMTRMHIVQVATVATVPREQFMIARAFVRNHRKVAALIVVLDELSCQTSEKTFPFYFPAFLFEDSDIGYLRHIFSFGAAETAAYRLGMWLGFVHAPERPDGFNPLTYDRPETRPERLLRIANAQRPAEGPVSGTPVPALADLDAFVAELDPGTRLLLYFAPIPANSLPTPASSAARWLDSCKALYQALAVRRPHTALVDRMVEDDFARDIEHFEDRDHVRNALAPVLERDIAAALDALTATSDGFDAR